ncbi:MAG: hypothetical protein LBM93_13795 [Oscillospiraceae bacterium]|jgi:hypothetical protein|nr:hypothetical protein [Oscillospiraceae bacterium]
MFKSKIKKLMAGVLAVGMLMSMGAIGASAFSDETTNGGAKFYWSNNPPYTKIQNISGNDQHSAQIHIENISSGSDYSYSKSRLYNGEEISVYSNPSNGNFRHTGYFYNSINYYGTYTVFDEYSY